MALPLTQFSTTYRYEPLHTTRHIRLLHVDYITAGEQQTALPKYSLVQHELSDDAAPSEFEAISYQWGDEQRVSALSLQDAEGNIGLTANLTTALPHLSRHSKTRYLWIDQICINQSDNQEKAVQIRSMTDIYKKATQVLVWLGPEDENSRTSRQWLDSIELLLPTLEVSAKIIRGSPTYHADTRGLLLSSVFHDPGTDPRYTPAVQKFWERPWFTRGWICQEFLLARNVTCLASDSTFTLDELTDLLNVPMAADSTWVSYRCLMWLKLFPFDDPAPRNYLRMMSAIAGEFDTSKYVDRLFGCLGLMEGLDFTPDYNRSIVENFTEFAVTLARDFGSLDFLSLWSANLDHLVSDTPDEIIASNFPSWVPSFTPWPLSAPWRLATGGARQYRSDIAWDAAQGRKHVHIEQKEDAVTTGKLLVRGKIIDHIDTISSTKFARYWDVDEEYLINQVNQVKTDLPALESWTYKDLITFLNIASASGNEPRTSTEDLLKPVGSDPLRNMSGRMESLGVCLSMGRGRRVMRTEKGHLGLAPAIGSKARTDGMCGSAIVVLHGCIVPVFLELVDEERNEWGLVGDCYVEGMMCGAAVDWEVEDADSFVLV